MHHLPQFAARDGVDADAGFIKQQDFRFADQGAGQTKFLLHAAGKLARQPAGKGAEGGKFQQPGEGFFPRLAGHAAQIGVERQVFHHRQIFIQAEFLRHIAEHRVQGAIVGNRVVADDRCAACVGLQQPGEHAHQGGFSRAVRAHQTGYIAGVNGAVQRRDGRAVHAGKAPGQAAQRNDVLAHWPFP